MDYIDGSLYLLPIGDATVRVGVSRVVHCSCNFHLAERTMTDNGRIGSANTRSGCEKLLLEREDLEPLSALTTLQGTVGVSVSMHKDWGYRRHGRLTLRES